MENKQLPFERYKEFGITGLTDIDFLAILLRTGTKTKNVMEVAAEICSLQPIQNSGLSGLCQLTDKQIMQISGIGEVKSAQLLCIAEIAKRMQSDQSKHSPVMNSPKVIADYYAAKLRYLDRENVVILYLNSKLKKISDEILTIGTINSSLLTPREVFVRALKNNAVSIALIHNHPSGDSSPSREDQRITLQLKEC